MYSSLALYSLSFKGIFLCWLWNNHFALGKPGCPVGKCKPLYSFHLCRELGVLFDEHSKSAPKDCPRIYMIEIILMFEAYKLTCVHSQDNVVSECREIITLNFHYLQASSCIRESQGTVSAVAGFPRVSTSHRMLFKFTPHTASHTAREASLWRHSRMYWNHPALLTLLEDYRSFCISREELLELLLKKGSAVHHSRTLMLIESTDVWSVMGSYILRSRKENKSFVIQILNENVKIVHLKSERDKCKIFSSSNIIR